MPVKVPSTNVPSLRNHRSTNEESSTRSNSLWKDRVLRLGDTSTEHPWRGVPSSLAIVGLITVLGSWIEPIIREPNLAIFYMLAVVFSAVRWGRWAVIVSAISSVLLFDYYFIQPSHSFVIGDAWFLITLIGLLAVGLIVSILIVSAREEARAARRREARVSALYSFTQALASGNELDQILDATARHFIEIFQRPIVVLLPAAEGLIVRYRSAEVVFDEGENKTASWVFENAREAGSGTAMFSGSRMRYWPLRAGLDIVGVIGFPTNSSRYPLSADQSELLGIFLDQTALALTRANLAKAAKHAEVLQEADKLQRALLNSVSHNLRTPLTSILGVLNTIVEDGSLLDVSTRQSLLKTAQGQAKQLDWLVQNLLDMTRVEGGAVRVKAKPCDVQDVIAAALLLLRESAHSQKILVTVACDLPLVPMDDVLMVQVLVNLLDNALKYSKEDAPVEIRAQLDTDHLEIRILDRGTGIPEGELERVFDKFYRVAVPGAPRGTGLGLSICRGFVEAHNGRILAMRRPQGGTEVALFLPLEAQT